MKFNLLYIILIIILNIYQIKCQSTDCNIYYDYLEKNGSQEPYNRNEDCCTLKNIKCNNGRIIYLYNNVNFISDDIYKLTALETLDISDSNASYLSEQILNLSNLRELNLSRNKISSLPSNFGKLTNLDILILNNNNFATLPSEIFKLPRLNFFSASGNKNLKLKLYNFGHAINYCFVDLESISCYDPGACIIRIKDINQSRTERESAAIMEQFPSCSNVIGVTNTQPFPTTINGQSTLTISPLSPTVINNDPNNPNNSNNSNIPTDDYINSLFDPNSKIFTDNNMQRYSILKYKLEFIIITIMIISIIIITDIFIYRKIYLFFKNKKIIEYNYLNNKNQENNNIYINV